MFRKLVKKVRSLRQGLTQLDRQPIGAAALTVVLLLDLFILSSIFRGLSDHTAQLSSPTEFIPSYCRAIVIERDWNPDNRLQKISAIVEQHRRDYIRARGDEIDPPVHPVCEAFRQPVEAIENDATLRDAFSRYRLVRSELDEVRVEHSRIKGVYDTRLLEQAGKPRTDASGSLAERSQALTIRLERLLAEESTQAAALEENPLVSQLFSQINAVTDAQRDALTEELRSQNFWYPVKRLGMEMAFLLPLLVVFYFWNARSIAADRPLQSLVSSHLLVIAFIPVLFKISELVYDIIPKKFIQHIIELLVSLRLVAVWHYLMMALAIVAALVLVYLLHKKLFSRQRLMDRRISKGQCQDCGTRLAQGADACHVCGFEQLHTCPHCQAHTFVHASYCHRCGQHPSLDTDV